jgi:predicted Fe-S protein YdhL (DUF1289 family)
MDAPSGLCKGCWRTISEIVAWSKLDDDSKLAVWTLIAQRKTQIQFPPPPGTCAASVSA